MEVPVDTSVIAKARSLYEQNVHGFLQTHERFSSPRFDDPTTNASFLRRFAGYKFKSDIVWVSPTDVPTFQWMANFLSELGIAKHLEGWHSFIHSNQAALPLQSLRILILYFDTLSQMHSAFPATLTLDTLYAYHTSKHTVHTLQISQEL